MKLLFSHIGFSGNTGAASAIIPGPVPESGLDRASQFSIQAGFYILPKGSSAGHLSQTAANIPGTTDVVHINFIWEQEVPGSDSSLKSVWPASGEYRIAFARILANMLQHRETTFAD